jgi:4-hydroxy-2-oxoheptanedioate aldolase
MKRENTLRRTMRAGGQALGVWLQSGEPAFAEIAGLAGLDFFILDLEHGPGDVRTVMEMMRAASGTPATGLVRVPSSEPIMIRRVLDAGAGGVLVPMVETAAEAERVAAACHYPPRGRRGMAADVVRGADYGLDSDYLRTAHEDIFVAVQIETRSGAEHAGAIAAVDGVDMIFVGPNDLSGGLGQVGDTGHPAVEAAIRDISAAARAAGKSLGTVPFGGRTWAETFAAGFDLVATGSDLFWFRQAAADLADTWREHRLARPT